MKDSNELLELCKQVYEATRWTADMDKGVDYVWCHETFRRLPIDWDTSDFHQHIPLYTSDYLLEKLPKQYRQYWLRIEPIQFTENQIRWRAYYQEDETLAVGEYANESTPLKALLKLTLKLHEEKIL